MMMIFIIIWKYPLCYMNLPYKPRESGRGLLARMYDFMWFYWWSKETIWTPPAPLSLTHELWAEPAASSSDPPFVSCSVWWPRACQDHSSHFPGDASWFWSQPAPGQRSAVGGGGAGMERLSQFVQTLVKPRCGGVGRGQTDSGTLNLLASVGLSQS